MLSVVTQDKEQTITIHSSLRSFQIFLVRYLTSDTAEIVAIKPQEIFPHLNDIVPV